MGGKKLIVMPLLLGIFLLYSGCLPKKSRTAAYFNIHLTRAISLMNQGQYTLARQELYQAISINPKSARAHNLVGLTYFRENNYDQAEAYFTRAIKLDPGYASGYLNLASTYALKEIYQKARDNYEKAINISPDMPAAYYGLGTVYFQLGEEEKGFNCLKRALELDPDFLQKHADSVVGLPMKGTALPELYFSLARLYASRNELDRTVENLEKARRYGFKDWELIETEPEFAGLKDDPRIKEFLKNKRIEN